MSRGGAKSAPIPERESAALRRISKHSGDDDRGAHRRAYNLLRWTEDGVSYWAVSDLAPTDLEDFAQLFRTSPSDQ